MMLSTKEIWCGCDMVSVRSSGPQKEKEMLVKWAHEDDLLSLGQKGVYKVNPSRPTALFLHGGGQNVDSWTVLMESLQKIEQTRHGGQALANLVAYDMRGHGGTRTEETSEFMTKEVLVQDCVELLQCLHGGDESGKLEIYLIGHSVGGAIATWAAKEIKMKHSGTMELKGLLIMDMVEELAMKGLHAAKTAFEKRPKGFRSLEEAEKWVLENPGMTENSRSAKYSVKGQLRPATADELGQNPDLVFKWRTDLVACFDQWEGWFKGLSSAFCSLILPNKTLLLAGIEKLDDTELCIGQMQGKFKLIIFSEVLVGHFVHEDAPDRTAAALDLFFSRSFKLPPHLRQVEQQ